MNLLFQFIVFSFISFSLLLTIGVPVVFVGSPDLSWNENKMKLYTVIGLWFILIFLIGILNSFIV
uniref:Photosystem II reaction center protein Z n=1 Tax=Glaukea argentea TaxID=2894057 RepID=A0A386B1S7_9CHLO|nr:photosystem II protein Z [Udotea argentea]AYC65607.1 photosystem II protein Z [Udotea argentea]